MKRSIHELIGHIPSKEEMNKPTYQPTKKVKEKKSTNHSSLADQMSDKSITDAINSR